MAQSDPEPLRRTALHDWHVAHQARMVAFGGWRMPLHYGGGVIREHVATRIGAGLFDICHMGRLRIAGVGAQAFLARVLTNDATQLLPGQAQYTLIANERGGAVDDAYLYRLSADDFLLVVNASNTGRDWDWLHAQSPGESVRMDEQSGALAMFALQGPRSEVLLAAVIGADAGCLPPPRRNRLCVCTYQGHELIVARTGYTGESIGFELVVDMQAAVGLWQHLVDAGATPVGLGARDSLRLEAGLPLYGHELGLDRDGREIPIFANALARYGVRKPGNGAYMGVEALDVQRVEFEAIAGGGIPYSQLRWLRHRVQHVAAFEGRRPLRAGYELLLGDESVGYVTSGSSVPIGAANAAGQYDMRPIGLALVRSDIGICPDTRIAFNVRAAREIAMTADLVERNLPAPPRRA